MAADRVITCTNQDGDVISFTEKGFNPFLLVSVEGVYDNVNNVNLMENGVTDGGIYQGSNTPYRNIVITVKDRALTKSDIPEDEIYINAAVIRGKTLEILNAVTAESSVGGKDFVDHRAILDKVFKRNELGRLSFKEDEQERVIDYYVEHVKPVGKDAFDVRYHEISLICPDPFFYDPKDIEVELAQIVADFEFVHEFPEDGEELGHNIGLYNNIYNESANENIGLTIEISGNTQIINPVITRMESGEFIQIGNEDNPFTLNIGETLIITTGVGNKHVYWIHDDTTDEINYQMANGSSFIQLMRGNNNFSYDANFGRNAMRVIITYRLQYARA